MGKVKHGRYLHPMYTHYSNMKTRCLNKNYHLRKDYGGRGITIFKEWINNIDSYIKYMESLPNALCDGYSPDRIDHNGNYEPGNMRWATSHEQNANRRVRSNNSSGYAGVYFDNESGKYKAQIFINGKYKTLGRYVIITDAVNARNNHIIENGLSEYPLQACENQHDTQPPD